MTAVSLAKGLEAESGKRMSQIIAEETPLTEDKICVLSGPNLSQEINRGLPATAIVAGTSLSAVEKARVLFNASNFTVFPSGDIIGVELCGALKNVVALGAVW
jgi:glycerol-3-phosphate dehydrogenase (NAD(P)+)